MRINKFILLSICGILLHACKPYPKEDFDAVLTLSHSLSYDDYSTNSGWVRFSIDASNISSFRIVKYGLSYSQNSSFEITENQVTSENWVFPTPETLKYSLNMSFIQNYNPYYFKAFAVTNSGAVFTSEVYELCLLESKDGTPPCTFEGEGYQTPNSTLTLNPNNTIFTVINGAVNYMKSIAQSGNTLVTSFRFPPVTGRYRTTVSDIPRLGEAKVSLNYQGSQRILPDQWIYVQKLSNAQFKVTVCNVDFQYSTFVGKFTGSWVLNY